MEIIDMQRSLFSATYTVAMAFLLILAGCAAVPELPPPPPTLTPTQAVAQPRPTTVIVIQIPDVITADQEIAQGHYEAGVRLLTRASAAYPNEAEIGDKLAQAQIDWGKSLIRDADDKLVGYGQATDHFSSGMAVARSDELRDQIAGELAIAKSYVWIEATMAALGQALDEGEVGSELLEQSQTMVSEVDRLLQQRQGDPVVAALAGAAMLTSGQALLLNEDIDSALRAGQLCARAVELTGESEQTSDCISSADQRTKPTPTPRTPPTPSVARLKIPDMRGADVGRARDYLRNTVGFTSVEVLEVTDPAQIGGDVCRQGVLYTSPPKGSIVSANTKIVILYRGSTNAPGLNDCNAN
ncbi:PASTA domain-containing protein [Oscillochloris sp. ZM17-4]|uniref:PASTA domain-containing protein n=1 Tax=Oscillochloris sp. ZM17-4 TaxID=2866714 RepID=UPI001C731C7E|nr:PASTA domain-containing protein [Oscillochloris sp. ZM17-4]MBX0331368.1 PASTA domain-containing protein [Oscillochloris sp. ZM17-4]